ncbi:MAG: indolepyruvate ferredoxin oxidoreductase [Spirochaetaceae bacterium]|jgi:indolepyruvate ferredoxin oxidoreductase alpha subunit|nr:indolepyruvate ferredoxin oxidoreductase [Spirochaetaceae bacterium]
MSGSAEQRALLGDEALALGAIHGGLSAAYGYPGTPSTEIMEYLQGEAAGRAVSGVPAFTARWCVNEKTALEAALGVSFAGRRVLVTMKHVGLNVAADPFLNGALLGIKGGLVVAAADDPGMHSSQCEQDSRFYGAFAMIPCLEPRSQQEAYDMVLEAFDISERFHLPVLLRLSTRLSHARAGIKTAPPREQNPWEKTSEKTQWMLLPAHARKNYAALIEKQKDLESWSEKHGEKNLKLSGENAPFAVITAGLGGNYYEENLPDLKARYGGVPSRLHIEAYPLPFPLIRRLCESALEKNAGEVLVIEEGQPFIEEKLRGILPQGIRIRGRLGPDPAIPRTGELDPDNVRAALGLLPLPGVLDAPAAGKNAGAQDTSRGLALSLLPGRPPQLCGGCPHADSYETLNRAVAELDPAPGHPNVAVNSDIGCYSLGAAPPYSAVESIVCMGASIGMARGAADAGIPYAFAVIGDSTFIHSGITALIDAVQDHTPVTVIILDNSIVAMTGCQPTAVPSDKLKALILGTGLDPSHFWELAARRQNIEENAARLRQEAQYRGPSVVVLQRECLEAARKRLKAKKSACP